MTRPAVSVVMPFAGSPVTARPALEALRSLRTSPGDELIFVDNSSEPVAARADAVTVIQATQEHSPAHARNTGAAQAGAGWILFLDADCRPIPDLLDAYFSEPVAEDVGALAGTVVAAPPTRRFVARYGAARSFLSQETHLAHPYRPRAVAANLLVRRTAFEQLGGFLEGIRAAEDTDFSWRLQQAGWRLELRSAALAEHAYRGSLAELRRQWRGYAAGRAWLARRYEGFRPQPALVRAFRARRRRTAGSGPEDTARGPVRVAHRLGFITLDGLLAIEELAGLSLSNRPLRARSRRPRAPAVVVLAEVFPSPQDPLVELAGALEGARVEALCRPQATDPALARQFAIDYLEDDGLARRWLALAWLLARHPVRSMRDGRRRRPGQPSLLALAPAVRRLSGAPGARLLALGAASGRESTQARIARLDGRRLDLVPRARAAAMRRLRVR